MTKTGLILKTFLAEILYVGTEEGMLADAQVPLSVRVQQVPHTLAVYLHVGYLPYRRLNEPFLRLPLLGRYIKSFGSGYFV